MASIIAKRPSDRLANKELLVVSAGDGIAEETLGVGLVPPSQLMKNYRSANPHIGRLDCFVHDGLNIRILRSCISHYRPNHTGSERVDGIPPRLLLDQPE